VVSSPRSETHYGLTPGGCFDHPRVWRLMRSFLEAVARRYRGAAHLRGWDIWNETRWGVQADGFVCYCAHTVAASDGGGPARIAGRALPSQPDGPRARLLAWLVSGRTRAATLLALVRAQEVDRAVIDAAPRAALIGHVDPTISATPSVPTSRRSAPTGPISSCSTSSPRVARCNPTSPAS
jgi:hypothetical protein